MYHNLAPPIASTILACISLVLGTCPYVLFWKGDLIRSKSRVAKVLKKEEEERGGQGEAMQSSTDRKTLRDEEMTAIA